MNQVTQAQFGMIPLQFIETDPEQPRRTFNQVKLEELAASVKESGVLQPILLRTIPDSDTRLQLVAGERRYRAAAMAGLTEIPGIVRQLTDAQVATIQLVENHQREGVLPIEEAEAIDRAMKKHSFSVDDVCTELGVTKAWVYSRLKLLDLTEGARAALVDGKVSASTALLVARIPVPALQEKAMAEIIDNHGKSEAMSHRDAKNWLESRFMLNLQSADFDPTDAKLIKACGSCTTCPKRTGNQPEQFADIDADVCIDPDCFAEKGKAHRAAIIARAKKSGIPVFDSADSLEAAFPAIDVCSSHVRMYMFTRLIEPNYANQLYEILKPTQLPKPVAYVSEEDGDLETFYDTSAVQVALEKAGLARTEAQQNELAANEKQERNEATSKKSAERPQEEILAEKIADAYNKFYADVHTEIKDALTSDVLMSIYRYLSRFLALATSSYDSNLEISDEVAETYDIDLTEADALDRFLDNATDEDVCRLYLDCLLSSITFIDRSDIENRHHAIDDNSFTRIEIDTLFKIANIVGLDINIIRSKHLDKLQATVFEVPAKKQPARPKAKPKAGAEAVDAATAPQEEPLPVGKKSKGKATDVATKTLIVPPLSPNAARPFPTEAQRVEFAEANATIDPDKTPAEEGAA